MPTGMIDRIFGRAPAVAALAYLVAIGLMTVAIWNAVAGVLERRESVAAAAYMLGQLEARAGRSAQSGDVAGGVMPVGSPFLDGQTVTIAGAALLQRVAGAVGRHGGTVLSSQVDLQGTRTTKSGFVSVLVSCEIAQVDLQQLLYDLEAGLPFLFVDELDVQAPSAPKEEQAIRLRVLLTVSGQWQERP